MKVEEGKTYQTMAGQRVEYIRIKMKNDAGDTVTFPVKGTIIRSEKPRRTEFMIWTLDGVIDPVWNQNHMDNLVEVQD